MKNLKFAPFWENMKRRIVVGMILGIIAGGIDLIPMLIQKLPLNANLSAVSLLFSALQHPKIFCK
jgi:hypothetical protein